MDDADRIYYSPGDNGSKGMIKKFLNMGFDSEKFLASRFEDEPGNLIFYKILLRSLC